MPSENPNGVHKRLPPFAREYMAHRLAGYGPLHGIWVTTKFNRAKAFPGWRVVVPDNLDPLSLDWLFVQDVDVIATADTFDRLEVLAAAILPYRPKRLVGVSRDPPRFHIFKKAPA